MADHLDLAAGTRSAGPTRPQTIHGTDTARQYVEAIVTVSQPMNSHGGMRLTTVGGTRVFQVVDYATEEIRESLARTAAGNRLELRVVRLGSRGDAWRVVALVSDG